MHVCLTTCMHGFWAWKPSYGQTSVSFMANPRDPCSANIWKTTRTGLTTCTSEQEWETKKKSTVCAENMGFCYELIIGKQRKLFFFLFFLALHLSRYNMNMSLHKVVYSLSAKNKPPPAILKTSDAMWPFIKQNKTLSLGVLSLKVLCYI